MLHETPLGMEKIGCKILKCNEAVFPQLCELMNHMFEKSRLPRTGAITMILPNQFLALKIHSLMVHSNNKRKRFPDWIYVKPGIGIMTSGNTIFQANFKFHHVQAMKKASLIGSPCYIGLLTKPKRLLLQHHLEGLGIYSFMYPLGGVTMNLDLKLRKSKSNIRSYCPIYKPNLGLMGSPKISIPIGPEYQAELPECSQMLIDHCDNKWLGQRTWPLQDNMLLEDSNSVGKRREGSEPGSSICVEGHESEKEKGLKAELGHVYEDWRFDEMGREDWYDKELALMKKEMAETEKKKKNSGKRGRPKKK